MDSTKKSFAIKQICLSGIYDRYSSNGFPKLRNFSYGNEYFDRCYLDGPALLHRDCSDPIYCFENKSVWEISELAELGTHHKCVQLEITRTDVSYFTLRGKYLFEFIVKDKSDSTWEVNVVTSVVGDTSTAPLKLVRSEGFDVDFKSEPSILLVDDSIIISSTYNFSKTYDQAAWLLRTDNYQGNKTIIYNLDSRKYHTLDGMIDFNIYQKKIAVMFTGDKFVVVDISTGKKIMSIDSELTVVDDNYIYAKRICVASRIPATREEEILMSNHKWYHDNIIESTKVKSIMPANCVGTLEFDDKGNSHARYCTIEEDENYTPGPDECAICYNKINPNCVLVPCGHRPYCESCIDSLDWSELNCAKCGVKSTQSVKICD